MSKLIEFNVSGNNTISSVLKGNNTISKIMFKDEVVYEKNLLPDGYIECEYIRSTTTQYINTLINPEKNSRIEVDFEVADRNAILVGCQENDKLKFRAVASLQATSVFYVNLWGATSTRLVEKEGDFRLNTKYHLIIDCLNKIGIMGNYQTTLNLENQGDITQPMYLFAGNNAGKVAYPSYAKVYSFKHYKNNKLKQNLIPCLDSNKVPCMYDTVSKKTFYNSGTGKFLYEILVRKNIEEVNND